MVDLIEDSIKGLTKEKIIAIIALLLVLGGVGLIYMTEQRPSQAALDEQQLESLQREIGEELSAVEQDLNEVEKIVFSQ